MRGVMGREFTPHSPEPGPRQVILQPSQPSTSGAALEQIWSSSGAGLPCWVPPAGAGAVLRGCSGTGLCCLPSWSCWLSSGSPWEKRV